MKRPAVYLAFIVIAGMLLGQVVAVAAWVALVAAAIMTIAHLLARKRWPQATAGAHLLWFAVLLIGIAQQRAIETEDAASSAALRDVAFEARIAFRGVVASDPDQREFGTVVDLKRCAVGPAEGVDAGEIAIPTRLRVLFSDDAEARIDKERLTRGDTIEGRWTVVADSGPANRGAFRYDAWLKQQGFAATLNSEDADALTITRPTLRQPFDATLAAVGRYREAAVERVRRHVSERSARVLEAIFFGRARALEARQREAFVRSGMAHLFAVSGLHTGVIALFLFFLLRSTRVPPRAAYVITCVGLVFFAALNGFRPSVVRAGVMFACMGLPFLLRYKIESISALAIAAVATLAFAPRSLWQPSFQLSYVCMFGLVTLTPILSEVITLGGRSDEEPLFGWRRWIENYCLVPFRVCLAAQLALAPMLALYFHRVSLIAPIANIVAALPAFVAICSTALLVTVGFISEALASTLGVVAETAARALLAVGIDFSFVPMGSIALPAFPPYLAGLYYLLLFVAPYVEPVRSPVDPQRRRVSLAIRLGAITLLLLVAPLAPLANRSLRVTFIDVGQGDSCLIEFPDGSTMLVDGGRSQYGDAAGRAILPTLATRGVDRLDVVVASHPDADHIGGLPAVMLAFPPRLTIDTGARDDTELARAFNRAAAGLSVQRETGRAGQRIRHGACVTRFLWPPADAPTTQDWNDRSLVMEIEYGEFSMLLTGDIDDIIERKLIARDTVDDATILKASHHGSRHGTSSAFLEATDPLSVLISCGATNRYGHPSPETLARIIDADALVFRTDRQGAVEYKTDGKRLWARVAGK